MTVNWPSTTATTRITPDSENSSTWPERGGPSKNVSEPARTKSDSTTTRSAPGTPGTDYHPRHARPHLPSSHRAHHQKRGREHAAQPDKHIKPETAPHIHRRLITLTLAEIRRLLNLIPRGEHAIAHGLHWSIWRRRHQAEARRAHVRHRLHLQTLMI